VSVILLIIGSGILLSAVGRRGRIRAGRPAGLPALPALSATGPAADSAPGAIGKALPAASWPG
jgi:hypothetical protein